MQKLLDQQQRLSLQYYSSITELKEELKKERETKEKLLKQPKEFSDNVPTDLQKADDKQEKSSYSKSWWEFWK